MVDTTHTIILDDSSSDASMDDDSSAINLSSLRKPITRNSAQKRKANAAKAPTKKRFKNHLTSEDVLTENKSLASTASEIVDRSTPKYVDLKEIDYNSSRFQPNLILTRLTKEELEMYLNPSTAKETQQMLNTEDMNCSMDEIDAILIDGSSDEALTESGRAENEVALCQNSKTEQTNQNVHAVRTNVDDAAKVSSDRNEHERDADQIDYKSWQWKPKLRLKNLSADDIKNVERSQAHANKNSAGSWLETNPIEFDKDESLIRELSPERANEQFQKVTLNVYQSCFRFY